jgi:hypothetical protein
MNITNDLSISINVEVDTKSDSVLLVKKLRSKGFKFIYPHMSEQLFNILIRKAREAKEGIDSNSIMIIDNKDQLIEVLSQYLILYGKEGLKPIKKFNIFKR